MQLTSLKGCRLAIGSYPHFYYNATNGGGKASVLENNRINIKHIKFSPETFSIPPLNWRTTRFLGVPLPPGLKIKMYLDKLEGIINNETGEIILNFEARFILGILSIFQFPSLLVKTTLNTGKVKSNLHEETGSNLDSNGKTKLVGIAVIAPTNNNYLNLFLNLPTEALAILNCKIE